MVLVKLLYKPVSLLAGVAGGVAAGVAFIRVWTLLTGQEDAPKATDQDHRWREVLLAAGVQGAVFGLVKAAIDRAEQPGSARSPEHGRATKSTKEH